MYNKVRVKAILFAVILVVSMSGCSARTDDKGAKNSSSAAGSAASQSQVSQTSQVSQASSTASGSGTATKNYTNEKYSFTLSYPDDWVFAEGANGAVCTITAPADQVTGKYAQTLSVTVKDLGTKKTLDGVDENEVSHFSSTMRNYDQLTNDNITLSHNIGYKIDFTSSQNGLTIRQANYLTVLNGREYIVTCSALSDDYLTYALQFTDILKTFTVK